MSEIGGRLMDTVITGDAYKQLPALPADSVHMCMTSPPYFGLRDYGEGKQVGLEDTLDEYIDRLVTVGDELRRVLRHDGSWWLNLGDSFDNKQKQLVPHRVAIALQDNGWICRNDVTWTKPNPMPSSVKDRLNTTTEQVFHLTPEPDYWYDLDAIREPHAQSSMQRISQNNGNPVNNPEDVGHPDGMHNFKPDDLCHPAGKNPGDVFEVTTKPFPEAHFAVYPPELCRKPIKATCPPKVCSACRAPYEREVEDKGLAGEAKIQEGERPAADEREVSESSLLRTNGRTWRDRGHVGWSKPCNCDTNATEPGIVLDPFAGAGTTLMVAKGLDRRFVGVELNPEYADMARSRVGLGLHDPAHARDDEAQRGFEAYNHGEGGGGL